MKRVKLYIMSLIILALASCGDLVEVKHFNGGEDFNPESKFLVYNGSDSSIVDSKQIIGNDGETVTVFKIVANTDWKMPYQDLKTGKIEYITIHKGDEGGYVSSRLNLSSDGFSWIFPEGIVYGKGFVDDDAKVFSGVVGSGTLEGTQSPTILSGFSRVGDQGQDAYAVRVKYVSMEGWSAVVSSQTSNESGLLGTTRIGDSSDVSTLIYGSNEHITSIKSTNFPPDTGTLQGILTDVQIEGYLSLVDSNVKGLKASLSEDKLSTISGTGYRFSAVDSLNKPVEVTSDGGILTMSGGKITGGNFTVKEEMKIYSGNISGGTFIVDNFATRGGTISGGQFFGTINMNGGLIGGEDVIVNASSATSDQFNLAFGDALPALARVDSEVDRELLKEKIEKVREKNKGAIKAKLKGHSKEEIKSGVKKYFSTKTNATRKQDEDVQKTLLTRRKIAATKLNYLARFTESNDSFIMNSGTITGGTFSGSTHIDSGARIEGGDLKDVVASNVTIKGTTDTTIIKTGDLQGGTIVKGYLENVQTSGSPYIALTIEGEGDEKKGVIYNTSISDRANVEGDDIQIGEKAADMISTTISGTANINDSTVIGTSADDSVTVSGGNLVDTKVHGDTVTVSGGNLTKVDVKGPGTRISNGTLEDMTVETTDNAKTKANISGGTITGVDIQNTRIAGGNIFIHEGGAQKLTIKNSDISAGTIDVTGSTEIDGLTLTGAASNSVIHSGTLTGGIIRDGVTFDGGSISDGDLRKVNVYDGVNISGGIIDTATLEGEGIEIKSGNINNSLISTTSTDRKGTFAKGIHLNTLGQTNTLDSLKNSGKLDSLRASGKLDEIKKRYNINEENAQEKLTNYVNRALANEDKLIVDLGNGYLRNSTVTGGQLEKADNSNISIDNSLINGGSITGGTINYTTMNDGNIKGGKLTGRSLNGTYSLNISGATIDETKNPTNIISTQEMTIEDATIHGGTITDTDLINADHSITINGGTITTVEINPTVDDITIDGGSLTGKVSNGKSTLIINGATINESKNPTSITANNTMTISGVEIHGGTITDTDLIKGTHDITINGGTITTVEINPTIDDITIDGGTLKGKVLNGKSTLIINGATINESKNPTSITANNTMTIEDATIYGGTITDTDLINANHRITISGGTINTATMNATAADITINAGSLTGKVSNGNRTLIINGAMIDEDNENNDPTSITANKEMTISDATILGGKIIDTDIKKDAFDIMIKGGIIDTVTIVPIKSNILITGGNIGNNSVVNGGTIEGGNFISTWVTGGTISDGDFTGYMNGNDPGLKITGGTINETSGNQLTINATEPVYIETGDITGGTITNTSILAGGNDITISGGELDKITLTSENNPVTVSGGYIGKSSKLDGGNISGGTITNTNVKNGTIDSGLIKGIDTVGEQSITIEDAIISGNAQILSEKEDMTIDSATITGGSFIDSNTLPGDKNATITGGEIRNSDVTGGNFENGTVQYVTLENAIFKEGYAKGQDGKKGSLKIGHDSEIDGSGVKIYSKTKDVAVYDANITGGTITDTNISDGSGAVLISGGTLNLAQVTREKDTTVTGGEVTEATLKGGLISGGLVNDSSIISGGEVAGGTVTESSTVSAGRVSGTAMIKGSSTVSGGEVSGGTVTEDSTVSGGEVSGGTVTEKSIVSDGRVSGTAMIKGSSTVSGGEVSGGTVTESSTVSGGEVSGGTVESSDVSGTGKITGGEFKNSISSGGEMRRGAVEDIEITDGLIDLNDGITLPGGDDGSKKLLLVSGATLKDDINIQRNEKTGQLEYGAGILSGGTLIDSTTHKPTEGTEYEFTITGGTITKTYLEATSGKIAIKNGSISDSMIYAGEIDLLPPDPSFDVSITFSQLGAKLIEGKGEPMEGSVVIEGMVRLGGYAGHDVYIADSDLVTEDTLSVHSGDEIYGSTILGGKILEGSKIEGSNLAIGDYKDVTFNNVTIHYFVENITITEANLTNVYIRGGKADVLSFNIEDTEMLNVQMNTSSSWKRHYVFENSIIKYSTLDMQYPQNVKNSNLYDIEITDEVYTDIENFKMFDNDDPYKVFDESNPSIAVEKMDLKLTSEAEMNKWPTIRPKNGNEITLDNVDFSSDKNSTNATLTSTKGPLKLGYTRINADKKLVVDSGVYISYAVNGTEEKDLPILELKSGYLLNNKVRNDVLRRELVFDTGGEFDENNENKHVIKNSTIVLVGRSTKNTDVVFEEMKGVIDDSQIKITASDLGARVAIKGTGDDGLLEHSYIEVALLKDVYPKDTYIVDFDLSDHKFKNTRFIFHAAETSSTDDPSEAKVEGGASNVDGGDLPYGVQFTGSEFLLKNNFIMPTQKDDGSYDSYCIGTNVNYDNKHKLGGVSLTGVNASAISNGGYLYADEYIKIHDDYNLTRATYTAKYFDNAPTGDISSDKAFLCNTTNWDDLIDFGNF